MKILMVAAAMLIALGAVARGDTAGGAKGRSLNPRLLDLPAGKWTKIHQQTRHDAVRFKRQQHGGSAFDTRRGRMVLFGSNTHGKDWTNSPLFFDFARLEWQRLYRNDHLGTYRINKKGQPVAGPGGDRPWAMHTFGAVVYDSVRDEIVVSSFPGHMVPGRFTNVVAHLWRRITHQPTWTLSLKTNRWTPLAAKSVTFFPYATAFDSDRGVVIGYRTQGIFELGGKVRSWRRVTKKGGLGYHNNAVYDSGHKALVVFGSHRNSNAIVVYRPATGEHRAMPTPGPRPPRDQHAPMACHPGLARTVVLVDYVPRWAKNQPRYASTQTWLYDLGGDAWTQVKSATLTFKLGMNYNMAYDPGHKLLLLVAAARGQGTTVWALRL